MARRGSGRHIPPMRSPLKDALVVQDEAADPADPHTRLAALFDAAEARENAYAAERLSELHELAARAVTLGEAAGRSEALSAPREAPRALPLRIASGAAGAVLAACAPLVAEASVLLAAGAGLAAAAALVLPFRPPRKPDALALPPPEAFAPKIEGVLSAADKALRSMTEPHALPAPERQARTPDEDVLALIQDALALARDEPAAAALAENAERLARRLGYAPRWEGGSEGLFETMIDPAVPEPLTLRPALVHADAHRSVPGVRVRAAR